MQVPGSTRVVHHFFILGNFKIAERCRFTAVILQPNIKELRRRLSDSAQSNTTAYFDKHLGPSVGLA